MIIIIIIIITGAHLEALLPLLEVVAAHEFHGLGSTASGRGKDK